MHDVSIVLFIVNTIYEHYRDFPNKNGIHKSLMVDVYF